MSDAARPPQPSPEGEQPDSWWTKTLEHWHDPTHPYKRAWWGLAVTVGIQLILEMDGQKRPAWLVIHVLFLAVGLLGALIRPPKSAWVKIAIGSAFAASLAVALMAPMLGLR